MCNSLLPLLALTLVIIGHVGCFFLVEKGEPTGPIVQLFEWRFDDIAEECEQFLGPNRYSGVQVSPVTESVSLDGDPWHERYQPISYKIGSRSGNQDQFRDMISRCTKAQVKVYVEVVINHMTKKYESKVYGTEDSLAYPATYNYPDVPYIQGDFRSPCDITDYNNATQVRNCALDGLLELDQSKHGVRCKISQFLNELIEMGVAGFSFSHAKYMWPEDLRAIIDRLDYLSLFQGFGYFQSPFIYQEFVEGGAVKPNEYYDLGLVTDFKYNFELNQAFSGKKDLKELKKLVASERALVFVDNHLTQRGQGIEGTKSLTYREARRYTLANLFMLAWPHGQPRIMSGYEFKNVEQGPPKDKFGKIARVQPEDNGTCANGWTCEHRWLLINQMVKFRQYIQNLPVENWWDNGKNQIAFSRGGKGFVVFNLDSTDMSNVAIKTGLPAGSYCDIFSGFRTTGGQCTGKRILVTPDGTTKITLKASDEYGVIAIFLLDWLPYLPVSLNQQPNAESGQGSENVNNAVPSTGTQEIQNAKDQKSAGTGKKEISSNNKQAGTLTEKQDGSGTENNQNIKTKDGTDEKITHNQENPNHEKQDGTRTDSQKAVNNDKTKVPSVGKEDAKVETRESPRTENKPTVGKRSLLYEQDTTFAKRGAPTTVQEDDTTSSEEKDQNAGKQKQDVKENKVQKTEHGGLKDNTGTEKQDKTSSDKQDIKHADKQTVSTPDKQTVSSTDKQTISTPDKQTVSSTDKQTVSTPDKQTVSSTDKQIVSTPDKQTVSSTDKQTVSTPDKQTVSSTDKQTVSTPDKQTVSTPDKQIVSTPDKQAASTPDKQTVSSTDKQTVSSPDKPKITNTDKQGVSGRNEQSPPSTTTKQDVSSTGTQQDPNANTKKLSSTDNKETQEVQSPGKEDIKTTTDTQNNPKSSASNVNQGSPNVGEQKVSAPETRELPILGRPWVPRADIVDVPSADSEEVPINGDKSWKQYYKTVTNRKYIKYARVANLMDNNEKKIIHSFQRRGFVLINRGKDDMIDVPLETELPAGLYCDVMTGSPAENVNCTGKEFLIDPLAVGRFTLEKKSVDDIIILRPENTKDYSLKHAFHRRVPPQQWNEVYKTVKFSVHDQTERFYKDIPDDQYALRKGKKGFMLFKSYEGDMVDVPLQTGLPSGLYCDMVSGNLTAEGECTGMKITVEPFGVANFTLKTEHHLVVIHEGSMIEKVLQ